MVWDGELRVYWGFSLKDRKGVVVLFEVHAVTCRNIRTTADYWRYIIEVKHPESFKHIAKPSELVMETLSKPKIVVREKLDSDVYLYYYTISVLESILSV